MDFDLVMEQMRTQYGEALLGMGLPPGVEEHLRARVRAGDTESVIFMLKLAWIFGAQAGHAAAEQAEPALSAPFRAQA